MEDLKRSVEKFSEILDGDKSGKAQLVFNLYTVKSRKQSLWWLGPDFSRFHVETGRFREILSSFAPCSSRFAGFHGCWAQFLRRDRV